MASSGTRPGKVTRATCGTSILAPAKFLRRSTCRPESTFPGSSPMAATSSSAAEARPGRSERSGVLDVPARRPLQNPAHKNTEPTTKDTKAHEGRTRAAAESVFTAYPPPPRDLENIGVTGQSGAKYLE